MAPVKCLSVRSPWAELIAMGRKLIELRTWRLAYRGPLVIVSTAKPARTDAAKRWSKVDQHPSRPLALVEMIDCRPAVAADEHLACLAPDTTGERPHFAWVFKHVRKLELFDAEGDPLTMEGQLSLYDPPKWLKERL